MTLASPLPRSLTPHLPSAPYAGPPAGRSPASVTATGIPRLTAIQAPPAPILSPEHAQRVVDAVALSGSPVVSRTASKAPGRHREPGSSPWRTMLRELAMLVSFGHWVPWRPASWRTRLVPAA